MKVAQKVIKLKNDKSQELILFLISHCPQSYTSLDPMVNIGNFATQSIPLPSE